MHTPCYQYVIVCYVLLVFFLCFVLSVFWLSLSKVNMVTGVSTGCLGPLQVFDGSSASLLRRWTVAAQCALTAHGYDSTGLPSSSAPEKAKVVATDLQAVSALYGYLAGAALAAVDSASTPPKVPADVFARLAEVFGSAAKANPLVARQALNSFRRPVSMEVDEAYGHLLGLCHRVDPQMPDEQVLFHLLTALDDGSPTSLGRAILARGTPTSVKAAMESARELQLARTGFGSSATPTGRTAPAAAVVIDAESVQGVPPTAPSVDLASLLNKLCAKLDRLTTPSAAAASTQPQRKSRGPGHTDAEQPRRRRRVPTAEDFTADGRPICFGCRQPGHVRRDCPSQSGF